MYNIYIIILIVIEVYHYNTSSINDMMNVWFQETEVERLEPQEPPQNIDQSGAQEMPVDDELAHQLNKQNKEEQFFPENTMMGDCVEKELSGAEQETPQMSTKQELFDNVYESISEQLMCDEIAEPENLSKQSPEPKDQETNNCEPEPCTVLPVERDETEPVKEESHTHVLFVTNLKIKTTEESLIQHFKQWGNVTKVNLVRMTGYGGVQW